MSIIIPPYLKPGDRIGIVSTASKTDRDIVEKARGLLETLGYKTLISDYALSSFNQFAAKDTDRASDFQKMIDNPDIKAIICTRGGYGTVRILKFISWKKFLNNPKWIVGFSDVTVLHSVIHNLNCSSVHGVMPRYFFSDNMPSESFNTMIKAISGEPLSYKISTEAQNRPGKVTAPITGGNLSILYSLRGTPHDIDTKGKILFIEDLDEYLYHIDRIMMNLKLGGKLENLAGLLVGQFSAMKDNETPFGKTVHEIILSAVEEYQFPVAFNFPAGHTPENFALKFGCNATFEVDNKVTILTQDNES
jgi:muramoyltetrapeptide carboxypeptidase